MKNKWRLILDPPCSGVLNMATDEALLVSACGGGAFEPLLRIYGWSRPTISVGYLQKAGPFADAPVPLVRRITGGRAILHDDELTYAVVAGAGTDLYERGLSGSYALVSGAIVAALRDLGIRAEFARPASATAYRKSAACFASSARHEVVADGRKVAAGAQRRVKGGLLLHGSIIFGLNRPLWESVFGAGVTEKTASIGELAQRRGGRAVREAFTEVFLKKLEAALGAIFTESGLTDQEKRTRDRLMNERYTDRGWNELAEEGTHRGGSGLYDAAPGPVEEMKKAADA
jgi:lipoate-protein ligase A